MARITGIGPITIALAPLSDVAEYSIDFDAELDEVADISDLFKTRVAVNAGWSVKISYEIATIGRTAGAISIDTWDGVEVTEYTFSAECDVKECTAQADGWKVWQAIDGDWSFDAEKWEATDSYGIFVALLAAQVGDGGVVAFSCPDASGNAYISKTAFAKPKGPSSEKITIQSGDGALTTVHALLTALKAQCTSSRTDGYATAAALVTPAGGGDVFYKKVEIKRPAGKATISLDLQGTGEFTPTA